MEGKQMDKTLLELNKFTQMVGLSDQAIDLNEIPWIPQTDRVWFKPVRFDLANGRWINLLRITPGGKVNRHRHTGGQVLAYTVQGQWRYLERTWVAQPGTFVYEPPGDIHTLVVDGEEDMITLFLLEGSIQYLDDNDQVIGQDDVFSKMKRYLDYCEQNHVPVRNLQF
jgi:2,4'-dihydroxyacetophenone dioxygenase